MEHVITVVNEFSKVVRDLNYEVVEQGSGGAEGSSWHERQGMAARDRIRTAIATLLNTEQFPAATTARAQYLVEACQMSLTTLYKNRDLWHPDYLSSEVDEVLEDGSEDVMSGVRAEESAPPDAYKSLLDGECCNCSEHAGKSSVQVLEEGNRHQGEACNPEAEGRDLTSDGVVARLRCAGETVVETIARVRWVLQGQRQRRAEPDFSVDTS